MVEDPTKKSGPAALVVVLLLVVLVVVVVAEICTVMSVKWAREPLVPVTLNVNDPTEALNPAVNVNGDVAMPAGGGVIGLGSENETSAGAEPTHDPESATAELNPLTEVTVIVAEPLPA